MLVVAAWWLHKALKGNMSHLQFFQEIDQTSFGKAPDKAFRPGHNRLLVDGKGFKEVFMLVNLLDVANNAKNPCVSKAMYCFT